MRLPPRSLARYAPPTAVAAVVLAVAFAAVPALADEDPGAAMAKLGWMRGPGSLTLGSHATIAIPQDRAGLPEADSSKFLELQGNLPVNGVNVLASEHWFAVFSFDPVGYVKDDEKIDADGLLKSMKDSDGPANEERSQHHLPQMFTDGWYMPPRYDASTHRLEWALRLHSSTQPERPIINYTVRLLGRTGYERATLVSSPATLDGDVAEFKAALTKFDFVPGEKYSEFRPGDHVAEFGLGALVLGGAAAVAAKTGFWKALVAALIAGWKLVAAAAVAALAGIRKFFNRTSKPQ